MMDTIAKNDGLDKITTEPATYEGKNNNIAKVFVVVNMKNGDTEENTITLVKVDGHWKIEE